MKRKMLISLGLLVLGERNFVVGVNFHIPLRFIYLLYITSNFHFKGNIFLSPAKPVNSFHLPLEINVIALETPVCHIR